MNDTHPEAERVQIGLIRKMSIARRAALASHLTDRWYWQSRRAIERVCPELSEVRQKVLFVRVHYGEDLARRVRDHWLGQKVM